MLFISASVVLALGLGVWCLAEHRAFACVSVVVAIALVAYETWFWRKTRSLS